jgi:hypothetical protein
MLRSWVRSPRLPDEGDEIEAPCSKLQGIFEVQGSEEAQFSFCSLAPQQAAGNALAMHFQEGVTRAGLSGTAGFDVRSQ